MRVVLPPAVYVVESPVKTHGAGEVVQLPGAFRGDHMAPMIVDDHLSPIPLSRAVVASARVKVYGTLF